MGVLKHSHITLLVTSQHLPFHHRVLQPTGNWAAFQHSGKSEGPADEGKKYLVDVEAIPTIVTQAC